jgi:uncharacterized protein YqeY
MSIVDSVSEQLKQAMRDKDKDRLQALRNIRAAFLEALKAEGAAEVLSDAEAQAILRKLSKQRRESIDAYRAGGRAELAEAEERELDLIESFLPKLADETQTRAWVAEAVVASGAAGPADMGKVMGALMQAHKDEIDGKLANRLVREALAG